MKISSITYGMPKSMAVFSAKKKNEDNSALYKGVNGEKLVMDGIATSYFEVVENVSNQKVGSKFIIKPKFRQYEDLRILITPESSILRNDLSISVQKPEEPSFKGRLYGSIREKDGDRDYKMEEQYIRFWTEGIHSAVVNKYQDKKFAPHLKDDYNFYIPSDGDGTRYKDITALQGGVTKPASDIPAQIDGKQISTPQDKAGAKPSKECNKYIQALNNLENKFLLHDTNK